MNYLFIITVLLAGCSDSTMSFLSDPSCGEEDEQQECQASGGVWEPSDKVCPNPNQPVNLGHCNLPDDMGYIVCAGECYE